MRLWKELVTLEIGLASLTFLSLWLLLWQWVMAIRFPLHRRFQRSDFHPAVTLLKSLKGCDAATEECLRSWFAQDYPGEVQILFGVVSADDPVCAIVEKLIREFPARDAELVILRTARRRERQGFQTRGARGARPPRHLCD